MNIDKLLKKRGWTGEELGRLHLANAFMGFSQAIQGTKDPKLLISDADFQKMLKTITEPEEGKTYNNYLKIQDWIGKLYGMAMAYEQQAQLNFNKLLSILSNAMIAEDLYKYIEKLPVIMTEKQYKDLVESRKAEIFADREEMGFMGFNVFDLLEQALFFYMQLLQKEPRKKNPLKPLKKKLEKEPVTDPRILTRYNKAMGYGYYEREDGTRSDKVPSEEWAKRTPVAEDPEAQLELRIKRKLYIDTKIMEEGLTQREAEKELVKVPELAFYKEKPATWHLYSNPPEDLNKWEILQAGDFFDYYPALGGEGTDEEELADIEAFKKEFPEVVATLLKDMEQFINGVSSIPTTEWLTTCYMWEDLYKADFYGFREAYVEGDTNTFNGNHRAIFNGIAILRPSDFLDKSPCINEKGYYEAPDPRRAFLDLSLENFFTESERYATETAKVEEERAVFRESIYYLLGYNKALELIAEKYEVEEVLVAQMPFKGMIERLNAFNGLVRSLYTQIKDTHYEDTELQEKKLEVLKDILYPIDDSFLVIPEERVTQAKRAMKNFRAFKDSRYDLCSILCTIPEGV